MNMLKAALFSLILLLLAACSTYRDIPPSAVGWNTLQRDGRVIYVSPSGSDQASGSRGRPLASIQKAIDMAHGGTVVKVEPGIYNENIRLRSRVSLIGSGANVTVLTADDGNILTADNVFDVVIEGFTLDGKDNAQNGLYTDCGLTVTGSQSPARIIFENNVVKNFIKNAIYCVNSNITIRNNTIVSVVGNGIDLQSSWSRVERNNISMVNDGVLLSHCGGTVEGNTIEDTRSAGIFCYNLAWGKIEGNRIIRATHGIRCGCTSPVIRANYISGSVLNGIYCYGQERGPSSPKIRGNTITQNHSHGLFVDAYSWPDLGREDDIGGNAIYDNGKCDLYSESLRAIMAVGNWWGSTLPDADTFHGDVEYGMALEERPQRLIGNR